MAFKFDNELENRQMSKPKTADGLKIYDLDPQASELWVVAGPAGNVGKIDPDNLPEGFRWVTEEEWQSLQGDQ